MSNKYWQSELWGEHPADVFQMRTGRKGFLFTVRIREFDRFDRKMLTQLIHPGGAKHSEHVFDLEDQSIEDAVAFGFGHCAWLEEGATPRD
ncbi:hypothetical protein ACPA2N_25740 [Ectopseudomonas hydrolytica]|uniref:hypothetical protein n=1 Tax=Ectopseudomonas hydrolytica TaxID=2493633 RepID=UPI003C2DAA06